MKTPLLFLLVMLGGAIVPPSALAGTASHDGNVFSYRAGAHELNHAGAERTSDCQSLAAPCLRFYEIGSPVAAPAGCVDAGFMSVLCPLPQLVRVDLGDRPDFYSDWDGPSVVHGGPDGDVIRGAGGADALFGDEGIDAIVGGPGSDRLDGGAGDDWLESYIDGYGIDYEPLADDSAGTDTISGGEGIDTADYEARVDPLAVSLDGRANDGAPGERDLVGSDVEQVRGGWAADTLIGGPRPDRLYGRAGKDVLRGGPGEDDLVDGGPGHDVLYGEYDNGCSLFGCTGGNDELRARDGAADAVECSEGVDHAVLDAVDYTGLLSACERVERSGGGAGAGVCDIVPRSAQPVCRIRVRALAACANTHGARRGRCLKRTVRRATRTCRKRFHGRKRKACVRSVRTLLPRG